MVHTVPRTLLVAALLVTAGCQGLDGSSAPPSDRRAVEALDRAREATRDVAAYRYTVDGRVRIRDDGRSRSIEITGRGVVDVDRRRANVTARTRGDTRVGRRDGRVACLEGYTLDVACSRLGWARYDLAESNGWLDYTPLGRQLAVLNRTNVYWGGTDTVDGTEAVVVTARPTERQLYTGPNLPPGSAGTRGGAKLRNATVRVWIGNRTGRVLRAHREIHVRGGGSTGVASTTFRFSGYDDPTDVTRPSFEEYGHEWEGDCPGT